MEKTAKRYCFGKNFKLEFRKSLEKKSNLIEEHRESSGGGRRYRNSGEHGLGAVDPILGSDVMHTLQC